MKELKIMLVMEMITWLCLFILLSVVPALIGLWPLAVFGGISMIFVGIYDIIEMVDEIERGF